MSLALLVSDLVFVVANYSAANDALLESFTKRGREQKAAFYLLLDSTLGNMQQMATFISLDPKIQQLFLAGKRAVEAEGGGPGGKEAARIRQILLQTVESRWKQMANQYDVRQLHFHLGPASLSFLRVHQPDKFGDRMDGLRFIIEDSYRDQSALKGFETGRIYSGLRGVVPMYAFDPDSNKRIHVGTLEVGSSFDSMFAIMDRQLGSGVSALLKVKHVNNTMWKEFVSRQFKFTQNGCNCKVEATSRPVRSVLQATMPFLEGGRFSEEHTHWVEHDGHNYSVTHFPLLDYVAERDKTNQSVGAIMLWTNVDEGVQAYRAAIRNNLIIALVGLITLELLIWWAIRLISSRLQGEIDQRTQELSEEVAEREYQQLFLKTVINAVQDPIMVIGADYRVQLMNHAAQHTTAEGDDLFCYVHSHHQNTPCNGDHHPCPLIRVLESGRTTKVVHIHYNPEGEERLIELTAAPMHDRHGQMVGIVESQRDITDHARAERDLVIAKEAAERANQAKSDFLANMSHEIRTPMNVILGMGELLLEEEGNKQKRHYLKVVQSAGEALLTIINDILDLSRIEAGKMDIASEPVKVPELLGDVVSIFSLQAKKNGLTLQAHTERGVPEWTLSDRVRLKQVLINLVSNAMKFTDQGSVTLSVEPVGEGVYRFAVTDTGIGIPPEKQALIFSSFIQADSSVTRRFGGTGLGLAICKAILEHMEGRIGVESEEGQGSRFYFDLPLMDTKSPHPTEMASQLVGQESHAPTPLTLLVAEDSEDNITLLKAYLKKSPHRITFARNGMQAVEAFKREPFDLVLMDVQMPEMDGYAATRAIRAWEREEGRTPTLIYALSAHVLAEAHERSMQAGCDGHLSKPIKKKTLLGFLELFPVNKNVSVE
ncbi:putative Autoinducer 2 sensor kinase/phosphatase luxQ [Magnetofaba australis IT-1]|uniref:Sensory/regulatory protein RpfC n=1 Tax=Magnetofaba australis IT-1 TaxID=1434232 RepID=A0A1Y2K6X7_9PROT|nr:putative Autoinducer 2 sensor kinase/phosphatase luxQ [Magnetofaba australis IT-1]